MSGVLEQEEVDALMDGLSSGAVQPTTGSAPVAQGKYDFTRQDYAVQRLIPAITTIEEQFAARLCDRLQAELPAIEEVVVDQTSVMKCAELLSSIESPCGIATFNAPPLGAPLILIFESSLIFNLVDLYYGGGGGLVSNRVNPTMSETEFSYIKSLTDGLDKDISAAWKSILPITASVGELHTDPRYLKEQKSLDTLVATRLQVVTDEPRGTCWSVVPWAAIDAIRDSLDEGAAGGKHQRDEQWSAGLLRGLSESAIDVNALLAEIPINLKRLSTLKKGDIIAIESPDDIVMHIDGFPVMSGTFGTHDGNMAVRIERILKKQAKR